MRMHYPGIPVSAIKTRKNMTKVKNGKGRLWRGLTSTSTVLLVFAVAGTQTAMTYTGTINSYLGTTTSKVVQPAGASSDDTAYFTSEFWRAQCGEPSVFDYSNL